MLSYCLVTGANGFVGRAMVAALNARGIAVRGALRAPASVDGVAVGNIGPATDWLSALEGIGIVVHTAARVHVMADRVADPLDAFRQVNVEGRSRLARQAGEAGVRRFIFISSIKVNGESTFLEKLYTAEDTPAPVDLYGISKLEAELSLRKTATNTGMEVVVIRPPLVYGPNVKGNFLRLLHWVERGIPLPSRMSIIGAAWLMSTT